MSSVLFCLFAQHLRSSGPLRDNYHFLFPITKSDVYIKLEKVGAKGLSRVAKTQTRIRATSVNVVAGSIESGLETNHAK